jgi:hypothetical protein
VERRHGDNGSHEGWRGKQRTASHHTVWRWQAVFGGRSGVRTYRSRWVKVLARVGDAAQAQHEERDRSSARIVRTAVTALPGPTLIPFVHAVTETGKPSLGRGVRLRASRTWLLPGNCQLRFGALGVRHGKTLTGQLLTFALGRESSKKGRLGVGLRAHAHSAPE